MTIQRFLMAVLCSGLAASASAQTCTPTYQAGMTYWSDDPQSYQIPDSNTHHVFTPAFVPVGYIAKMRTISLSTKYGGEAEYMIEHLVNVPGGNHYHEVARGQHVMGTPALHVPPADAAAMVLFPGERLAGRALGGTTTTMGMTLYWSYWLLPAECLPRVLGLDAPATSTTSTSPPPDFSAMRSFLEQAAASITSAAQAVP